MALTIRDADLFRDREELIRFLRQNLTEHSDGSRYDWLYLQNPCGPARAWIALDQVTGRTVGVAGAFPRTVWLHGEPRPAWVLGDFCVDSRSRTLGPALQLQRACLSSLAELENTLCYDFPSRAMMAVYRRLGVPTLGNQVRYVKLTRIDTKVRSYISSRPLAHAISRAGNLALRFQYLPYSLPRDVEASVHEGLFEEEFTKLDSRTVGLHPIRGLRTAEYLNWRYVQNPFNQYRVVVARRRTELLGYGILEVKGTEWVLTDLHAIEEPQTLPVILAYLDRLARTFEVEKISAPIMEGSSLDPYLRRAGFHAREGLPVVACAGKAQSPTAVHAGSWFLMHGDRES